MMFVNVQIFIQFQHGWLQYDFSEITLFHVQVLCQQSADHVA
jgi:hypothetical protein